MDSKTIKRSLTKKASPIKTSFTNLLNIKQLLQQITDAQKQLNDALTLAKTAEKEYELAKTNGVVLSTKNIPNFALIKSKIEEQLSQLFQYQLILNRLVSQQSHLDKTLVDEIIQHIKTEKLDQNVELLSSIDNAYEEIK